jgi:ribose 5-phosphate isomerase B
MRIALGADHGGFSLKQEIAARLRAEGREIIDLGATSLDPADDYPDFALAVARAVVSAQAERGIVICGSGVGAGIAANKVKGARASICHDTYSAAQGVEHDDMNILVLGARVIGSELARVLVDSFLHAKYSGEARHQRRLNKVLAAEREA